MFHTLSPISQNVKTVVQVMFMVHADDQALTGSDFQLRVGSGRVVNLKIGLSGTLGSGSDKFSVVNWPS